MMKCSRCFKEGVVKNGHVNGRQRYRCNECKYNFTKGGKKKYPLKIKKEAIRLYIRGTSFREIGRTLKISHVSVIKWVREASDIMKRRFDGYYNSHKAEIDQLLANDIYSHGIEIDNGPWMRKVSSHRAHIIPLLLHKGM